MSEHIYAVNCREEGETGSTTTRFMGRGTRTGLDNSWERFVDWRSQVEKRGERKEQRVKKKKRAVGQVSYTEGERVRHQDIKSNLRNKEGVMKKVRTADDGTIVSYDIDVNGVITTRHR